MFVELRDIEGIKEEILRDNDPHESDDLVVNALALGTLLRQPVNLKQGLSL